jgi:HemK-related putative methylase
MDEINEIYIPREDSFLLKKNIIKIYNDYFKDTNKKIEILDIGTGSGILAKEASKYGSVIAVDINPEAIKYCKKEHKNIKNIKFIESDLFSNINEKFDLIIFNPPYLPEDEIKDIALTSGDGTKTINKFLKHAKDYLFYKGKILLLFSSLTNKEKVENILIKQNYEFKQIDEQKMFFEKLYVYEINYKKYFENYFNTINELIKLYNLKNIEYLAKGKRGIIYKAIYKDKIICIKIKKKESYALGNIENEVKFLKILNKHNIGPKYLFSGNNYLIYEFVEGEKILDFISKANKKEIIKVLNECLKQCFILDKLNINKFEMHHPIKHILIDKKIVMIDFERCRFSENVKNVTQFLTFIIKLEKELEKKEIKISKEKIMKIAKEYSNKKNEKIIKVF